MALGGGQQEGEPITSINVTPLVDVSLVLVIIFMVTAPIMQVSSTLPVHLPAAATVEKREALNSTVTLTADGKVEVSGDKLDVITNEEGMEAPLKRLIAAHPDRLVIVRADKSALHGDVVRILSMVKRLGATRMAVATVQRSAVEKP
jgi:biopolymer transport protein ExbD